MFTPMLTGYRRFPRIAVGGGREVNALRAQGYDVFGFDPAVRREPNTAGVVPGSFAELIAQPHVIVSLPGAFQSTVDALIIGWSGLSYVYRPERRLRIFRVATVWCPKGPILMSDWSPDEIAQSTRSTRAGRFGGRLIGRYRDRFTQLEHGCAFIPNAGLTIGISSDELSAFAGRLNRRFEADEGPGGYGTMDPS